LADLVELIHARFEARRHLIEQHEKIRSHNAVLAVAELAAHLAGRIEKVDDSPRLGVRKRDMIWRVHS
jgi:hypothetical protein